MKRHPIEIARLWGRSRVWTVWVVVGSGLSSVPVDGRIEMRAVQTAPETGHQTPAEPASETVATLGQVRGEAYTYDPDRRRDPFVSLFSGGANLGSPSERPAGLAGLSVNDVSLRGLVLSGGVYLAVMQAPDNKTYILRGDELLFDAVVKSVSAEGITFLRDVNDPLSVVKAREVLWTLGGQRERR